MLYLDLPDRFHEQGASLREPRAEAQRIIDGLGPAMECFETIELWVAPKIDDPKLRGYPSRHVCA